MWCKIITETIENEWRLFYPSKGLIVMIMAVKINTNFNYSTLVPLVKQRPA